VQRRTDVLKASPPMFESRVLDALSRVHPSVPIAIFAPTIVALFAWELSVIGPFGALGLALLGYGLWTLFEYWLHRIVFHFEPDHGIGARLHWIIHGVHHEHPNDRLRLVMPPAVSVPLAALVFGALYLVFGERYVPAVGAGFFAGYLAYDMIHYYVHHFRPRSSLGRMLRERHMRHHFQDDTKGFGISAPYWDEVFGTSTRTRGAAEPK
jgi:dihydroceramide fatty acyl 2-hydroxylase